MSASRTHLRGQHRNVFNALIGSAVQPGNSGGPLLDTSGNVAWLVAEKLNALTFAKAAGEIPENINFAIKTGAVRDFLDNSVVPIKLQNLQLNSRRQILRGQQGPTLC
jgi:S1-C subfamily serine protease